MFFLTYMPMHGQHLALSYCILQDNYYSNGPLLMRSIPVSSEYNTSDKSIGKKTTVCCDNAYITGVP